MALDSKQKRGAAIGLSVPTRPWLAEPDGTLSASDRLSLMKLGSAEDPTPPATFNPAWAASVVNTIVGMP